MRSVPDEAVFFSKNFNSHQNSSELHQAVYKVSGLFVTSNILNPSSLKYVFALDVIVVEIMSVDRVEKIFVES